jgi:Fe-S cluster assembly iron-binding protein IscA
MNQEEYNKVTNTKFITKYENNNTNVYVDPMTEMHLLGTTIDYVQEDFSKGFFENKFVYHVDKDLMRTCGCGTSFTLK